MILRKSGKISSSYPAFVMLLRGDAVCYTTVSAEFFVLWDPEICNLCEYKKMI